MKYPVKMVSGVMIQIPSFVQIGSGIEKLIGGIHREKGYDICLLLFFSKQKK
jgi:hypothetical protein